MPFGFANRDESFAILDAFWEFGGNAIDLGWLYRGGESSTVAGEWVRARGLESEAVLYTKGCHPLEAPRVSAEVVRSDFEDELRRTGLDHIAFFGFHRDDPTKELEPIVEELGRLRAEGKVTAWGASNWTVARIEEFNRIAESLGVARFAFNNPNMSLGVVNEPMWSGCHTLPEDEYRWHIEHNYPLWSWSSTGGGWFAFVQNDDMTRVWDNPTNRARREKANTLATEYGLDAVHAALAWVLDQPFPTWAIVGNYSPDQARSNAKVFEVDWDRERLRALSS